MQKSVVVMHLDDVAEESALRGRVNTIRRRRFPLDSGIPGVNLEFGHTLVPAGYFTPRHRHNFEQIRYTIKGVMSTGHGDLATGECGYFPEGTYYGPQEQEEDCWILILQFQGPSGEHFLSNDEANATVKKLLDRGGKFEDGVYKGVKEDGKRFNKDSYSAIWEEFVGKKLVLPAPRYRTPVMMSVENFRWVPARGRPGIFTKHLGTFTELRSGVGFMKMMPGSAIPGGRHEDAEIRYVLEGSVRYGGRQWQSDSYFYIPSGASTEDVSSHEGATFFTISLPMLADWNAFISAVESQRKMPEQKPTAFA